MTTSSHAVAVPVTTLWASPDAPRDLDRAMVADVPDHVGWHALNGREERLGLHGRTLTQVLLGEPADVIDQRGRWAQVVLPWQPSTLDARGYPGWLPLPHLTPKQPPRDGLLEGMAAVRPLTACLRTTDGVTEVSCGTLLPTLRREGSELAVALPDGQPGRLDVADVVYRPGAFTTGADPDAVAAVARRFVGLAYLWGGTSGWGIDCSGLVHLALRVHGVAVPRDAHDQHSAMAAVALDDVRPYDLLFFARPGQPAHHVGFATETGPAGQLRMLHAPESGQLVEEALLAADRRETLAGAARIRPAVGR